MLRYEKSLSKYATIDKEAKRLKEEEGLKHIIVLSHGGNQLDKQLAKDSQDIDIIFGAHTHNLIKGITEGENLFYSKTGEPVIITQAGKDGENLGILNVSFDQDGVIKKAQNNIIKTRLNSCLNCFKCLCCTCSRTKAFSISFKGICSTIKFILQWCSWCKYIQ